MRKLRWPLLLHARRLDARRLTTDSSISSVSQDADRRPPLVRIQDATFYRRHPSPNASEEERARNKPLFSDFDFSLPADNVDKQYWAIIGPSNAGKTTFLELLQGQHICVPPTARRYPYLSTDELLAKDKRLSYPARAIQYVGFSDKEKGLSGTGTYMSARYESRREATDFSVGDFLRGNTQLNVVESEEDKVDLELLDRVTRDLRLAEMMDMPVSNLSNGQTRRARIAKALLGKPELLLLDEPFMGLDPPTTIQLSPLLRNLAYNMAPRLLLSLRPQDPIPDWITHVIYLGKELQVTHYGTKAAVSRQLFDEVDAKLMSKEPAQGPEDIPRHNLEFGRYLCDAGILLNPERLSGPIREQFEHNLERYRRGERFKTILDRLGLNDTSPYTHVRADSLRLRLPPAPVVGEPLIEMNGVQIKYGDKIALGNWDKQLELHDLPDEGRILLNIPGQASEGSETTVKSGLQWSVRRGERWAVVGPNGSGKTTLLSLISSDHPQAYSTPMKLFGRTRLPQPGVPGLSLFDIQSRIGHSSPEVHAFFPRNLSVRRTIESAYADTPLGRPKLTTQDDARVDACLRWFQGELNPSLGPNVKLQDEILRRTKTPARVFLPGMEDYRTKFGERARQGYQQYKYEHAEINRAAVEWADEMTFRELTFSAQRVALFLRAIVAQRDIVILDEAFSGMDDVVRDKCLLFLEYGESRRLSVYRDNDFTFTRGGLTHVARTSREIANDFTIQQGLTDAQALIVVSHVREEMPRGVRNILYLPEGGGGPGGPAVTGPVTGRVLRSNPPLWDAVWGIPGLPRRDATAADEAGIRERLAARDAPKPPRHWKGGRYKKAETERRRIQAERERIEDLERRRALGLPLDSGKTAGGRWKLGRRPLGRPRGNTDAKRRQLSEELAGATDEAKWREASDVLDEKHNQFPS